MVRGEQTQVAVLGVLSIKPMSGYAVREHIRDTLGHFWSESFGQIYPALAELEHEGLIERREQGARSSEFAVTPRGAARLRELLAQPPQLAKPRNGVLLRLFFGRQLGPDACRQLVLESRARAQEQLAAMEQARQELGESSGLGGDLPYLLLTISAGEHMARATLQWADDALANLSQIPEREQ